MMVDPWGLKGTGLTYVREPGTPLKAQVTGIYGVSYFGKSLPVLPNIFEGIKKAQPVALPVREGLRGFEPDWVKKKGKSWTDGFVDAFTAEANEALDGIKNAPEAIQEAVSAFLDNPGGFIGGLVKAGLGDFGELLNLIELRSNPKHPYDAGQRNGKLAFRALGFLGGAGLAGLAARAPKLFKLLTGRRKPRAADNVTEKVVRTEPRNLSEKLTLDEAKGGAGRRIMQGKIKDAKYPEDVWAKMQHVHEHPGGAMTIIHYWENIETGAREGFKFK